MRGINSFVIVMICLGLHSVCRAAEQCKDFTIQLMQYDTDNTTIAFNDTLVFEVASISGCNEGFITIQSDLIGPDGRNETADLTYEVPRVPELPPSNVPMIAVVTTGVAFGAAGAAVALLKALTFLKSGVYRFPAPNPYDRIEFNNL